jgi:uncharacterized protein (DUF2252 family)
MDGNVSRSCSTIAVVLGASDWPMYTAFEPIPSCERSCADFVSYLKNENGLALPEDNIKVLFDLSDDAPRMLRAIRNFIRERQKTLQSENVPVTDLLIYYVGHGGVSFDSNAFFLAIRATDEDDPLGTSITADSLGKIVRDVAAPFRNFLILDCCFAASMSRVFLSGGPLGVAAAQLREKIPPTGDESALRFGKWPLYGTALLCASGSTEPARVIPGYSHTMFTGALLDVLGEGDSGGPEWLSLTDVQALIRRRLQQLYETKAVLPQVHAPLQHAGRIDLVPLFPNRSRSAVGIATLGRRASRSYLASIGSIVSANTNENKIRVHDLATLTARPPSFDLISITTGTEGAIKPLIPIRHHRMSASPSTFLRGTPSLMAADLGSAPSSGIYVQACGDANIYNFRFYASSAGTAVFDIGSFSETIPAPFEWDVKRLATSVLVEGVCRGWSRDDARALSRDVARSYHAQTQKMRGFDPILSRRSRVDPFELANNVKGTKHQKGLEAYIRRVTQLVNSDYGSMVKKRKDRWQIIPQPPVILPLSALYDDSHQITGRAAFDAYISTIPDDVRSVMDRFQLVDLALVVFGIGSVGTFDVIGLFSSENDEILLLEAHEVRPSTMMPYVLPSRYRSEAQRVVVGQRILQTEPDIFLNWVSRPDFDGDLVCRTMRYYPPGFERGIVELPDKIGLSFLANLCGRVLAQAHARSGNAAAIWRFIGPDKAFEEAIVTFAVDYSRRTTEDWREFRKAISESVRDHA